MHCISQLVSFFLGDYELLFEHLDKSPSVSDSFLFDGSLLSDLSVRSLELLQEVTIVLVLFHKVRDDILCTQMSLDKLCILRGHPRDLLADCCVALIKYGDFSLFVLRSILFTLFASLRKSRSLVASRISLCNCATSLRGSSGPALSSMS